MSLLGKHSPASAARRLAHLVRTLGVAKTFGTIVSALDDKYLKTFDRRYGVRTCGYLTLDQTGFTASRLRDATNYSPTNGWAVRRMFREWQLPHTARFADLGSGMGRTCLLAAEYGFASVTGVELAPELCAIARANLQTCRWPQGRRAEVTILHRDALDYCADTEDDVFYMFRPFSADFLRQILDRLAARAWARQRTLTILYSERAGLPGDYAALIAAQGAFLKERELICLGQAFHYFTTAPGR
jgi:SAM-dependent methyltransferase